MSPRWPLDPGAPEREPEPGNGQSVQVTPAGLAIWIDRDPSIIQRVPREHIVNLARAYLAERGQRRQD